ncbi:MAG: prenyltransferase/squalene oxidase repeat-containing protein [Bacillota bacterium]
MLYKSTLKKRLLALVLMVGILMTSIGFTANAAEVTQQESAITKAIDWLKANQNADGSWGSQTAQQIITTSQTATIFASLGDQNESVARATYWMDSQELINYDFIARVFPFVSQDKKNQLISELLSSQNADGGWGISKGYESDILDTCLILDVLMKSKDFKEEVQAVVIYLTSVQNQDGSWGLLPGTEGSIYATSLVRAKLYAYKESFRTDITEALEKSSQWLLGMRNTDGMWGNVEDAIYLSAYAYKALNADKWQDVKNVPEKLGTLQLANGSWEDNHYLTVLALEVLLINKENSKVELKDIKIFANGIETTSVNAKEVIEIAPVYTGRNVTVEVSVINPDGVLTKAVVDSTGRYLWPSQMNKEGIYSAEVVLKNEAGVIAGKLTRSFTLQPYIQANNAYIEITPGSSKLNKPILPIVRLFIEGESNVEGDAIVALEIIAPDNTPVVTKQVNTKLINGENTIELGSFTPDTSSVGTYNISATVSYQNKEVIKRTAKFKVLEQISSVYTNDEDFDKGNMSGVNHSEVNNQLQLNKSAEVFPYIWIANAGEGTLSKLDTRTGKEVARYRTGPNSSTSPSRTAVDKDGNCWVANRVQGTVLKVAMTGGIDRNGNGVIDTSRDVNNNGLIDSSEILPWGQDEAILSVTDVGYNTYPRALAIDKKGRIWVGIYNQNKFIVLNSDGTKTNISIPVTYPPYGASIDSNGILWSATLNSYINKIDTNNDKFLKHYYVGSTTYGIVVDKNGIVWSASSSSNSLIRFDPTTEKYTNNYGNGSVGRGVAVDKDGNVWASYSGNDRLNKFDATGKYLLSVNMYPNGRGPIGVGVDGDGNIWAVNQSTNNATKIKIDGTILGYYRVGSGPYTYSDMTGFNLQNITTHEGTWTVVHDGAEENYKWSNISWHEKKPQGTDIIVSARSANDPEQLLSKQYIQIQNGEAIDNLLGRFIQVEVKLKTSNLESPVLEDIAFGGFNGIPVANAGEDLTVPADATGKAKVVLDGTNSYDPDGDKLTYKWTWNGGQAEGSQTEVTLPEGTTKVTLVVNDGTLDSNPDDANVTVVGNSSFKSSLVTNKTEYDKGETVSISVYGKNESSLAKKYALTLDILDKNNGLVINIVKDMAVDLSGGQEQVIAKEWNIGTTVADNYIVRAVWKENNSLVAQNTNNIFIKPDGNLINKVATDKAEYGANETVNITETVSNTSTNSVSKELTIKTVITDSQGTVIWNQSNTVNEILQNGNVVLKGSWNTLQASPGAYTVTSEVYKDNVKVSQAGTLFNIKASSFEGIQSVKGNLQVKTKNIYPADTALFDYDLTNTGNVAIENLTARVRVVDVATEKVIGTLEDTLSLGLNETVTKAKAWTHEPLKTGTYMVILDANFSNGKEVPLGSGYIKVEKPYETTINQVVRPRVLVWAESQGNIDLAKKTLEGMKVYYKTVNTREAFMAELRTGKYNLYMLLDSKKPLTGNDDKELAAEVAKGKGIIASRDANGDNLKNLGLFGVKFNGSTTPHDFTVNFSADSVFGKLTLSGTGKARNLNLDGGQQLAVLNSKKGASPGVVTYKYQNGKSLLFAFDIGSCTGDIESVLKKAVELTAPASEVDNGYTELEVKVKANTAIGAEIKLNIPQGAEIVWLSPDANAWNFEAVKGQEYTFRVILKLPQAAGQYSVSVDSLYGTPNGMLKFDSVEVKVTRL